MPELQFFDADGDVSVLERRLPHWAQAGTVCFITFRTHDSLPRAVLERFHADRRHWLRSHQIDPAHDWRAKLGRLDRKLRREFARLFSARWHAALDQGLGDCPMSDPEISDIVCRSLLHFDGDRYEMADFVVMPNHVHLLAAFPTDDLMLVQCESWKRFTANRINRKLGRSGRFWQQDGFDHLVRSEAQFARLRAYIASNPRKAKLAKDAYRHFKRSHLTP